MHTSDLFVYVCMKHAEVFPRLRWKRLNGDWADYSGIVSNMSSFLRHKSCSPNIRVDKYKRYPHSETANNYHLRKVLILSGFFETTQLAQFLSFVVSPAALASSLTVCAVSHPASHAFLRSPVLSHVETIVSPTWSVDGA